MNKETFSSIVSMARKDKRDGITSGCTVTFAVSAEGRKPSPERLCHGAGVLSWEDAISSDLSSTRIEEPSGCSEIAKREKERSA